jgi:hypothetical protein
MAVLLASTLPFTTARAGDSSAANDALADSLAAISEAVLAEDGGRNFNWVVANQLRHFHAGRGEAKSIAFCDRILRHSIMDSYVLDILADWNDSHAKRTKALEEAVDRHVEYPFVCAAAMLEVARIARDRSIRRNLLEKVASIEGTDLEPYRVLAKMLLTDIGVTSR